MAMVGAIFGLLFYINSLDLIAKNSFTGNLSGLMLIAIIARRWYSRLSMKRNLQPKTRPYLIRS
jgi:hypothetical protein